MNGFNDFSIEALEVLHNELGVGFICEDGIITGAEVEEECITEAMTL